MYIRWSILFFLLMILSLASCGPKFGPDADLKGLDLQGENLVDLNLEGADFTGADLRKADLSDAKLSDAVFVGANFEGAKLDYAFARDANFSGATMTGASFRSGYFGGANFQGADLSQTDFSRADVTSADFSSANLNNASLEELGGIYAATWDNAILTGVDLRGTGLIVCSTSETSTASNFEGCRSISTTLKTGVNLSGENLEKVDFSGWNLAGVDFSEADLERANLAYANLTGADLSNANMTEANFTGAILSDTDLAGTPLEQILVYQDRCVNQEKFEDAPRFNYEFGRELPPSLILSSEGGLHALSFYLPFAWPIEERNIELLVCIHPSVPVEGQPDQMQIDVIEAATGKLINTGWMPNCKRVSYPGVILHYEGRDPIHIPGGSYERCSFDSDDVMSEISQIIRRAD